MKKLMMAALTVLAVLALRPEPCAAWQALVDDDLYSTNKLREYWFRRPDGRLQPRWYGWTGYGYGRFFAAGGHHRRHRRVVRGAR